MNPLDDTLNVGATLPRQSQSRNDVTDSPSLDDLANQQTIRLPGAGSLVFSRYRLQRVLGRGGMGVVWLAVDTKLERAVALKFLPDIVGADPVALKELKDETRRGLELAHPNIVRIYDFVDDEEAAAISMEFVDGKSLSERRLAMPHRVFSAEDLSPWLGQMCDALDYAHLQKRIVHRDLKPANLMVGSDSEIKITDFGIARSVSDTISRLSRTMQNSTSGTLLYMSPQQAMGDRPRPTDDVYALGATLYELLTAKPPFYTGDISTQITSKIAPSLRSRREELEISAEDEIPKEWEQAIASCLEKDPAKRPQSAGELARRLGLGTRGEVSAPAVKTKGGKLRQMEMPAPSQTELKKKSPVLTIVLCCLFLLALLGGAVGGSLWVWLNRPGGWVVQTDPPGAQVTLGDLTRVTPATILGLKPGAYRATIAMDGYEPRQVDFKVQPGQSVDLGVTSLQRMTGSLLLSSDPDGVNYEVKSATDESAQTLTGNTPDTIKLPVGKYSVSLRHGGELKTTDLDVTHNSTVRRSFEFPKKPEPAPAPPVMASAPPAPAPPAPPVALVEDRPPPAAPTGEPGPAAASAPPGPSAMAFASDATQSAGAPPPVVPPTDAPPQPDAAAAAIAAQPPVEPPPGGYWKISEIFAGSDYGSYSNRGRGYVLYKVQSSLKQKGHYKLEPDASPGPGTHKAIVAYQQESSLQPTGRLDEATLESLGLGNIPDKRNWGDDSDAKTPESEKTAFRKFFEKSTQGSGEAIKDKARQIGRTFKGIFGN